MKDPKNKGILYILCAAVCFSLMTFFVRLSGDVPFLQKSLFRNGVVLIFIFFKLLKSKDKFKIQKSSYLSLLMRAGFGFAGLLCNFYAIDRINIADANMLNKLSPFFAIIFSYFILKEKVMKYEWAAVFVAFIGALFVMKPSFQVTSYPAFMGALGGMGAGIAYTFVRKLSMKGERGEIIIFFFSLFSSVLLLPVVLMNYHSMNMTQWIYLLLAGIAATGGQISITAAYSYAPAKEIGVYDYTQILFAAILGYIFLSQKPDILSILGYALIIGAAVYKWRVSNGKSIISRS